MRADALVALAAAHRIDLSALAACKGQSPPAKRSKALEDMLAGVEVVPATGCAQQKSPRSVRGLYFGDPDLPWCAARYSFAGDLTCYWPLWWGLVFQAQRVARRDEWPPQVRGARGKLQFYLLDLAQLVLDEEANRPLFVAAPVLFSACLRVEPETWRLMLAPHYRVLRAIYERWLAIARTEIQQRCRELTEGELEELSALMQEEPEPALAAAG